MKNIAYIFPPTHSGQVYHAKEVLTQMKRLMSLASLVLALVVLPSASQAQFLHQGYTVPGDVDGNLGRSVIWTDYAGNESTSWRLGILQVKADPVLSMRIDTISLLAGLEDENLGGITELSLVRLGAEANFVNLDNSPGYADKWMLGTMTGGTGDWGHLANFGNLALKEYTFGGLSALNITIAPGQDEWFALAKGPTAGGTQLVIPTSDITGYRSYYGWRDQTPKYRQLPYNGTGNTWGANVSASPVPEPASMCALALGIATMSFRRRFKKAR